MKNTISRSQKLATEWNREYSERLATRADFEPGRICWDTAATMRASGADPATAAAIVAAPYKR